MSAMANTTPVVTTVTKTATKEKATKETDASLRVNILDFCEEHYEEILPVIMDKIRRDKRKEVYTRLDFRDNTKKSQRIREGSQNSSAGTLSAIYRNPSERPKVRDRLKGNDGNVFGRLGHRRQRAFDQLSDTYSPSTTENGPDRASSRDHSHSRGRPHRRDSSLSRDRPRNSGIEESYGNTGSSYRTGARHEYHSRDRDRPRIMKRGRESESPLSRVSESGTSDGGHWKSKSKRRKPTDEDDLAVPWSCEEVDPFTPRIRNFKSSRKTQMPNNVKTYDGTGDPEDHVKKFQAAAQVEHWAMPTWCHMFNSTLIGTARVWFDELPPESIDGYKDLKAAFLAYFMQQKKYVKDLVEIHNIKQRDRETIEDFMEWFKVKTGRMKGSPECM
ncbi:reverse transcriptase domain-containing protein [Tanacetum coccineum]